MPLVQPLLGNGFLRMALGTGVLAYVQARAAELFLMDEPLSNLDVGGMDLYARHRTLLLERNH